MSYDSRWMLRVLGWLLPASMRQALLGDLEELYRSRLSRSGPLVARLWLGHQCLVSAIWYAPRTLGEAFGAIRQGSSIEFASGVGSVMRQVRRSPGFALLLVLMIGLGVGANVTVFSLVDGVLLSPMPYPDSERIVSVSEGNPGIDISVGWTSMPNFKDWQ